MNVFIDIETIPEQNPDLEKYKEGVKPPATYKKAESIKKWMDENADKEAESKWLKTSFNGAYGEIVCICIEVNGSACTFKRESNEKALLASFWTFLDVELSGRNPYFIAHNAKFDLPFLWHRSVINRVRPVHFMPHGRNGQAYYCTMESWAGFNKTISMDNLAKVLGIEGKSKGMTGADVWPEYQKGNIDKIAEYCADDVRVLREIYNRMTFA